MNSSSKAVFSSVFAVLFLLSFTLVRAQDGLPVNLVSPRPEKVRPVRTPETEKTKERLSDPGLKACESREQSIKNRGDSLVRMSANMLGKFDAIVTRLKDFYQNKVLPTGKTVPNYDDLLADIATKKTAVESALSALPETDTFDCNSDDPKAQASDFREKMKDVKEALNEYRTSVKNLIVAIHRVLESKTPKPVPTPTP